MNTTCLLCSDRSACRRGKISIDGGCFIAYLCVALESSRCGLDRLFASAVSPCQATGALPAVSPSAPPAALRAAAHDSRLVGYLRMSHAIPPTRVASRIRIVGIAMFVGTVESSPNRIACEIAPRMCARRASGPAHARLGPTPCAWAPDTRVGPLICAWAAPPARMSRG